MTLFFCYPIHPYKKPIPQSVTHNVRPTQLNINNRRGGIRKRFNSEVIRYQPRDIKTLQASAKGLSLLVAMVSLLFVLPYLASFRIISG